MNWLLIVVVLVNLTFSTFGDIVAKLWGITNNHKWFFIGLPINLVTIIFYMLIVKIAGLAIPTTIVLILTILISVILGFVIFKENIIFEQWIGLALALIAIPLLLGVFKVSF